MCGFETSLKTINISCRNELQRAASAPAAEQDGQCSLYGFIIMGIGINPVNSLNPPSALKISASSFYHFEEKHADVLQEVVRLFKGFLLQQTEGQQPLRSNVCSFQRFYLCFMTAGVRIY